MELKEPLLNNILFAIIISCIFFSCSENNKNQIPNKLTKDYSIDTSNIPNVIVEIDNPLLTTQNGIFYFNKKHFNGYVIEHYPNGNIHKKYSIGNGLLHGNYISFYTDGSIWEHRKYKNGLSTGKHRTYWPSSGLLQTEYNYFEERMEGVQRKWYKSGVKYLELNYVNDREEGFQKGWRENGKLFLNYEVRNGFRYGLQKAALCYTLRDEKLK